MPGNWCSLLKEITLSDCGKANFFKFIKRQSTD
jgi:hypothetical protein